MSDRDPDATGAARLDQLFARAGEVPASHRADVLAELGASAGEASEVLSLLAARDAAGSFLDGPVVPAALPPEDDAVAGYEIVRKLGEGGFGVVVLAEQTHPVKRRVALKMLKAGMDTAQVVRRFEGERQALALMEHPGIARVFDAGTTRAGRPYFAMEYTPGRPITEAADAARLGTDARLALFLDVCDAVSHAHTKGILHRDLKPGNVLVAQGDDGHLAVKVIDFGIAKALHEPLAGATLVTSAGQMMGTLESMAPEQAAGAGVDTRTDVYALGVLLYELLSGELPFASETLRNTSLAEAQRVLLEVDPPRPSARLTRGAVNDATDADAAAARRDTDVARLRRRLEGDLDWITMKALEKRPEERYASVAELAADVRRHRADEPVQAGRPSALYRTRKFVRRHRVGVLAGGAVGLAVIAGLVGVVLMLFRALDAEDSAELRRLAAERSAREARDAERRAQTERATAEAARDAALAAGRETERAHAAARTEARKAFSVIDFLVATLGNAGAADADAPTLHEALAQAEAQLSLAYGHDPQVEALLRRTLGLVYLSLDDDERAAEHLRRAVTLLQREGGPDDPLQVLSVPGQLQIPRDMQGEVADLLSLARERGADGESLDAGALLSTSDTFALLLSRHGSWAEAEALHREALASRTALLGRDHVRTRHALNNLAASLQLQGRPAEAAELWHEVVALYRGDEPLDRQTFATILANLSTAQRETGHLSGAEASAREAVALWSDSADVDDPARLTALVALAGVLQLRGALDEAEALLRDVHARRAARFGPAGVPTLSTASELAMLLLRKGRYDEASTLLAGVVAEARERLADGHWFTAKLHGDLGTALIGQQRWEQAEHELRIALEGLRAVFGIADPRTQAVLTNLIFVHDWNGRFDEAEALRPLLLR